jgi:hypothetical protein
MTVAQIRSETAKDIHLAVRRCGEQLFRGLGKRRGEGRQRGAEVDVTYAASVYELLPSPMYDSYTCSNSALHFVWYVSFV